MPSLRNIKVFGLYGKYRAASILNNHKRCFLFYDIRNWGDQLNRNLAEELGIEGYFLDIDARNKYLIGTAGYQGMREILMVGSVGHHCSAQTEICGSGVISPNIKLRQPPKKIHAVRGPLTRQYFVDQGIECPEVFGDPALLLPRFFDWQVPKTKKLGIVLHNDHKDESLTSDDDVMYINLRWGFEKALKAILSCENIASSSLHGLIAADAYGIPNTRLVTGKALYGGDFKFNDYYSSIGIDSHTTTPVSDINDPDAVIGKCHLKEIGLDLDALHSAIMEVGKT